ncbi:MAG: phosphatidylserine decarboxylase [Armatimonadetes bacterium]|nr:phosphatidylserine decarboxylase [Armatimonadota bacterium]
MLNLNEKLAFFQQLQGSFDDIGALLPTSSSAARAMVREAARHHGPKRILEAGPGTGPVTAELVKLLGPEDRLVLCELNAGFVSYLEERFQREPEFVKVRHQVRILHASVTDVPEDELFDYIVSAIPFTRLEPELVEQILEKFKTLLNPAGVLTYIEYQYLRAINTRVSTGSRRERLQRVDRLFKTMLGQHQFRCEPVYRNVPPAWIRSLRFTEADPEKALEIQPMKGRKRLRLGPLCVNQEALGLMAGLGALSLLMRRTKGWWLPLMAAGATALFHRDPEREVRPDPDAVYSACDGRIMGIEKVRHPRLGDQEWTRVSAFLGLTDVHINRVPVAGKVVDTWEEPGGFAVAYSPGSEHNFSRYIVLDGVHGRCAVAQRAGLVARKIVTWCARGELLSQGERFGMIRFGSRTDIYLPYATATVLVREGDRVAAGETVVARYVKRSGAS